MSNATFQPNDAGERRRSRAEARDTGSFDRLITLWRDVSLFAAAFAYLAGWTYIRSYYREFEIDPNILDIAINNYFVYAFFALLTVRGLALIAILLVSVALIERFGAHKIIHTTLLVAFAFALFRVSRFEGANDGRAIRGRYRELPAVNFTFKDATLQTRMAADPNSTGDWFLITATKDKYLVLVQKSPDPAFPDRWPAATTLAIPASEVIGGIRVKDVQK